MIQKRNYNPGDIAECFCYGKDDNHETYKFHLRLIEKIDDSDPMGYELWTTIPFDKYTNDFPLSELDWAELGEPTLANIINISDFLH